MPPFLTQKQLPIDNHLQKKSKISPRVLASLPEAPGSIFPTSTWYLTTVIQAPENPIPSSDTVDTAHTWCTDIHVGKPPIHTF